MPPDNEPGGAEPPPAVEVVGTTLRVRRGDGTIVEGMALTGATLVVTTGGKRVRVRVASVERDVNDPRGEVLLYDLRVRTVDGAESPLCAPDHEGRRLGFPARREERRDGLKLGPGSRQEFELVCSWRARKSACDLAMPLATCSRRPLDA